MKIEITIVNPTVTTAEDSEFVRSYLSSGVVGSLYVQFVFLINTRQPDRNVKSEIRYHGTHEILFVRNERFFATCEENMFRIQDFIDLLKPRVFFIGDGDLINWESLVQALESFQSRNLGAMGWNLANIAIAPDGTRRSFDALGRLNENSRAQEVIHAMHSGDVVTSRNGYGAMMSVYGPVGWAAYIGSHIFRRETLAALLQYRFLEFVYAHVYMQAQFFCSQALNYGYYRKSVVTRVSADEGTDEITPKKTNWPAIQSHRLEAGLSACPWVSIVGHLTHFSDARIFNLLTNSMNVNLVRSNTGTTVATRQPILWNVLCWSVNAVGYKRIGQSFYFPEHARNGSLQDIRYVARFLNLFATVMDQSRGLYSHLNGAALGSLEAARRVLNAYLNSLPMNDEDLKSAYEHILNATKAIPIEAYYRMNDLSYHEFIKS